MNSLVNSIYLQPKPISEETKANYFKALKNLDNIHGEFLNLNLTKENGKWQVEDLSDIDRQKIHGLYGV